MQYALEILPSLLKGSKPHLASVCFRIDFIDSTRNRCCLFLLQLRSKILQWTPNDLYLLCEGPSIAPVDSLFITSFQVLGFGLIGYPGYYSLHP